MRSKPLLIGVTGGIGSGKSTVCRIFSSLHVPVYHADDRAKGLMVHNSSLKGAIINAFGPESYDRQGGLNRSYLAESVFNDSPRLEKLNSLVHPVVARDFEQWAAGHADEPYVIKEAALLFEAGSYRQLDKIISVLASKETRLRRVLTRDPYRTNRQVLNIMDKQLDEEERKRRSDYLIDNEGTQLIIPQVLALDRALGQLARNGID